MRTSCLFVSISILTCVGCGGSTTDADAGRDAASGFDAGTGQDAGAAQDAGVDAGTTADAGSTDDAGATDDAGSSSDAGMMSDAGSSDGGAAACSFVDDLTRGCTTDANCVVGVHQTDCCGNTVAIGINHGERARFDAAEAACQATYPACGCPSGPTTTDSGETTGDTSTIQVACVSRGPAGICLTYVTTRPPDGV